MTARAGCRAREGDGNRPVQVKAVGEAAQAAESWTAMVVMSLASAAPPAVFSNA